MSSILKTFEFLSKKPFEEVFYVKNGKNLNNLQEVLDCIKSLLKNIIEDSKIFYKQAYQLF